MYNIIVCDDERDIVSALEIYLTAEGYHVLCAENGREALALANSEDAHLMLLDVMMPQMDGLETLSGSSPISQSSCSLPKVRTPIRS